MRKRVAIALASLGATAALAGGAIAFAGSDSEGGVSGPQADHATKAALEATGGGTANAVERDSENGATWEVEVTKTDGTVVDVRLDENFKVMQVEGDSESADTGDAGE
jgi:hypothetical protein